MPAGVPHVHPWNIGRGEMVYRQTNDFGATTPDAVSEVLGALATFGRLAEALGYRGVYAQYVR